MGWEPVGQSSFARYHADALRLQDQGGPFAVGTYELVGPKVNGNPEGFKEHWLMFHAFAERLDAPRDFDGLAVWLHSHPYEGIVWHDGPGRAMAKIKRRDFRPPAPEKL